MAKKKIIYDARIDAHLQDDFPFKIYKKSGKHEQKSHTHNYIQIWFVKDGTCTHCVENKEYNLTKGEIFVLPAGINHSVSCENAELIAMDFTEAFVCDMDANGGVVNHAYIAPFLMSAGSIRPRVMLGGAALWKVESLLDETLHEFSEREKHWEIFVKANVLKLLALLVREYERGTYPEKKQVLDKYRESVVPVLDYVHAHYAEKISLEEMCKLALLSPSYFSVLFKEVTGSTFIEYVNHIRIMKAKELLARNDKTITGVSLAVGYIDPAYFSKQFKKLTGISPLKFRQAAHENMTKNK